MQVMEPDAVDGHRMYIFFYEIIWNLCVVKNWNHDESGYVEFSFSVGRKRKSVWFVTCTRM